MKKPDLKERLIKFTVLIVEIVLTMPETKATNHLAGQLLCLGPCS